MPIRFIYLTTFILLLIYVFCARNVYAGWATDLVKPTCEVFFSPFYFMVGQPVMVVIYGADFSGLQSYGLCEGSDNADCPLPWSTISPTINFTAVNKTYNYKGNVQDKAGNKSDLCKISQTTYTILPPWIQVFGDTHSNKSQ